MQLQRDIKGVVFDYGNVLSLPQAPGTMERLAELAEVNARELEPVLWALRPAWDRGDISGIRYYATILEQLGRRVSSAILEQLVEIDMESWSHLNSETIELVMAVQRAGRKVGILSNMPVEFLQRARERFPLFHQVDGAVYSCEVRVNKPDRQIYEHCANVLGCSPSQILFFDDLPVNIEGARAVGFQAFLWEGAEEARRILVSFGIIPSVE